MDSSKPPFGPAYGFGVYLHWPYCTRICPYCDFNVYAAKDRQTGDLFQACLTDLETQAQSLSDHPPPNSIFLGGGTPSLMSPQQIEAFISRCDSLFGLSPDCEITLEANPTNITDTNAPLWREAGVTRLSIGMQSLDDAALEFLGRDHSSAEARRAAEIAQRHFTSVSLDFIYARPGQSLLDWKKELSGILTLGADHLSLYELTIAENTAFHKQAERGQLTPLPDTLQAAMYELTGTLTQAAGLSLYEISNFARTPAHQSQHNSIYWRSGDWLGIGPGAHGRLTHGHQRFATEALAKPEAYIAAVKETGNGLSLSAQLSQNETAQELLTMGLRPSQGIELSRIENLLDASLPASTLDHLQDGGWLIMPGGRITLTPAGRLLADRVALELLS